MNLEYKNSDLGYKANFPYGLTWNDGNAINFNALKFEINPLLDLSRTFVRPERKKDSVKIRSVFKIY